MSTLELQLHPLLHPIEAETYPKERVQQLWQHLQQQDYAFDDQTRDDPSYFIGQFMLPSNLFFELGDMQGFVSAVSIQPKVNCMLHFSVWGDLKITEVMRAGKSLEEVLFHTFELNRLSAFIPNQNLNARRLATLLGFKEEGNMRKSFLSHGNYQDLLLFGLLRSEWEKFKQF